jgi:methionyl-tRNA synthetase
MELPKSVLIVPMQPTPNGRLHVGHGAGPYLRADVLARALRVAGHQVAVISGSDAFENWVIADALSSGRTPSETCDYFHAGIQRDLQNLGVVLDHWIDPRSEEHHPGYRRVHEQVLAELQSSGVAQLDTERVPFSVETGRAVIGTWIAGDCPNCGKPCGGSSCVFCAQHFQPEEVLNPRSRLDDSTLEWRPVQSWFARPRDPDSLLDHLRNSGVRRAFLEAVQRYLDTRGGRIRLSGPGSWGIRSDMVSGGSVLANSYYLYSVYCGEVYRQLVDAKANAFADSSDVTTIGVFGSDNSTPGLLAPHVIAQGSNATLRPFDYTIVNAMLYFEGQKCSTSKRHGIWLSELLESDLVSSDELRYFLAGAPLDEGQADISLQGLVESTLEFRRWTESSLRSAVDELCERPIGREASDSALFAVERQHAQIQPGALNLPVARDILDQWMQQRYDHSTYTWLLGLALLGEPFIPNLARRVWSRLGYAGAPRKEAARTLATVFSSDDWPVIAFSHAELSVAVLAPYAHIN